MLKSAQFLLKVAVTHTLLRSNVSPLISLIMRESHVTYSPFNRPLSARAHSTARAQSLSHYSMKKNGFHHLRIKSHKVEQWNMQNTRIVCNNCREEEGQLPEQCNTCKQPLVPYICTRAVLQLSHQIFKELELAN